MSDFYRQGTDGWRQWSFDTTGTIEHDKPSRIFLTTEPLSGFTISHHLVTSSKDTARPIEDGNERSFFLNEQNAEWLYRALGQALGHDRSVLSRNKISRVEIGSVHIERGALSSEWDEALLANILKDEFPDGEWFLEVLGYQMAKQETYPDVNDQSEEETP